MPQQPGWGQQPGWAPPAPKSQSTASSNRPFLVILLFVLLIGLGFLTYKYTPIGETLLSFFNSSTGGTGTADTTKPAISAVTSTVGIGGVTINWSTDELASSQVEYGKTTAYGSVFPDVPADDPTGTQSIGVTAHSVIVSTASLEQEVTYHYRVKSKDKAGNESVSSDKTFTTVAIPE
jgi:hypothetical protein